MKFFYFWQEGHHAPPVVTSLHAALNTWSHSKHSHWYVEVDVSDTVNKLRLRLAAKKDIAR
jgi:hypothetical protein